MEQCSTDEMMHMARRRCNAGEVGGCVFTLDREFKIQVHVVTRTAKRTDDVILDVFSKLRTSSYKFTTCKTSSTSKDKT